MIIDKGKLLMFDDKAFAGYDIDNFIYLGSLISNEGGSNRDIKRRNQMGRCAIMKPTKILKDDYITKHAKIKFIRTLVFSR